MAFEYVLVSYREPRRVFIDGADCGATGDILRVDTGRHRFHLGAPFDYGPLEVVRLIEDTNPLAPEIIVFLPE